MIKTIKVKKQLSFRELMEYIFSKGEKLRVREFKSKKGNHSIKLNAAGRIFFSHILPKGSDAFNHGETYEVEVEEEITEDVEFDYLIVLYKDGSVNLYSNRSINHVLRGIEPLNIQTPIAGELVKIWQRSEDE